MFDPEELLKNLTKKEVAIYYYYVCKRWQHKEIAGKLNVKLNQHGYYDHWTSARDKLGITSDPEDGFNQRFCFNLSEEIVNNWPDKTKSSPPVQLPSQEKAEGEKSVGTPEKENSPRISRVGIFFVVGLSVLVMAVILFGVIFLFTGGFDRFFMRSGVAPNPSETAVLLSPVTSTDTPEGQGVVAQQATPLPLDTATPPPPPLTPTLTPTPTQTPTLTSTFTITPTPTDTPTITPDPMLLFETHFEDKVYPKDPEEWEVLTNDVLVSIDDKGVFTPSGHYWVKIGNETWKNYKIAIDFTYSEGCFWGWSGVNVRAKSKDDALSIHLCDDIATLYFRNGSKVPNSEQKWVGRGFFRVEVIENKILYHGKEITLPENETGAVYIGINDFVGVRKIRIVKLP